MSKRRTFDYRGYPCEPHNLTEDAWYYVCHDGITVCQSRRGTPTEVAIIPWAMVRKAMRDRDAAPQRRPKAKTPRF